MGHVRMDLVGQRFGMLRVVAFAGLDARRNSRWLCVCGCGQQRTHAGVPDATVAALLGHRGTAMIHHHYSHLGQQAQVLKDAAERVAGGRLGDRPGFQAPRPA